jgi:hypothetical protein
MQLDQVGYFFLPTFTFLCKVLRKLTSVHPSLLTFHNRSSILRVSTPCSPMAHKTPAIRVTVIFPNKVIPTNISYA